MSGLSSNTRRALRTAKRNGWFLETHGRHLKLRYPGRTDYATISASPSDTNAEHNIIRDLKRLGAI